MNILFWSPIITNLAIENVRTRQIYGLSLMCFLFATIVISFFIITTRALIIAWRRFKEHEFKDREPREKKPKKEKPKKEKKEKKEKPKKEKKEKPKKEPKPPKPPKEKKKKIIPKKEKP